MTTGIVKYKDQIIAHIFSHEIKAEGVKFLSPDSYTLQLGLIEHPSGKIVKDHIHRQDIQYQVDTTQEFLYIEKGQVKIKLFSNEWEELGEFILSAGDFVLLVSGGHGLEVVEDCRIIEIKQGPYPGDQNAKIFRDIQAGNYPPIQQRSTSNQQTDIYHNHTPRQDEYSSK